MKSYDTAGPQGMELAAEHEDALHLSLDSLLSLVVCDENG